MQRQPNKQSFTDFNLFDNDSGSGTLGTQFELIFPLNRSNNVYDKWYKRNPNEFEAAFMDLPLLGYPGSWKKTKPLKIIMVWYSILAEILEVVKNRKYKKEPNMKRNVMLCKKVFINFCVVK
jgi:hypothetical protein